MDESRTNVDATLLEALRQGDPGAAGRFAERYWQAIHRFCLGYLQDEQQAEDVTQATFAKLSGGDDGPQGDVRPWLYKVARNQCLDILRRRQISPTFHRGLRTGVDPAQSTAGPATRAAEQERSVLIRQIIEAMPEEYRVVLTLKYFEDFSRGEMAAALGLSDAAVKGRLARASEMLRDELAKITGSGA